MQLVIGNYEVTISAKYAGKKGDPKATEALLNEISSAFYGQARQSEAMGCPCCAEREKKMANDIYEYLEARGCYEGMGENK